MIDKLIERYQNDMIQKTQELIQIPSVFSPYNNTLHPFGKHIHDALTYMLNLGQHLGFQTKNLDGYCGYIEFGDGDELIGIIGHLDVVPEGDGWTYPRFRGTIYYYKIYCLGAIDY